MKPVIWGNFNNNSHGPRIETDMNIEPNNIYCGDCLELMKQMPDNSVDLVISDPQYGMNYISNRYKAGNPFGGITGDDDKYPAEMIPEFKRVARKAVFSFCRWDNLQEVDKPKSFIVWAKNNWTAGDLEHEYGRMWEGILFYPQENHSFKRRLPDVINFDRVPPTQLLHPTQKPVDLISRIIINNSDESDTICDPYCGSGTTAIAAIRTNRRYIGIDIEQKYVDIANKRIGYELQQTKLKL